MSKYELAVWPQDKYRFSLFDNAQGLQTTKAVLAAHPGAVGAINLWYFSMVDQPAAGVKRWDHQNGGVKLRGKWVYEKYDFPGLCIDKDGHMSVGGKADAVWDYTACVQADYINGQRTNTKAWPRNGVTYTGQRTDGAWVGLVASVDNGLTSQEAVNILLAAGCVTILRWDGSWSSQGQLLPGQVIKPSQHRAVRGWLIIYPRDTNQKEDKPVGKYKVTASIGLNIRNAPNGTKVGAYAYGALVSVLEVKDGWGLTNMGWVSMAHLEAATPTVRATDNGIAIQQRIIKAGRKNRPGNANSCANVTIHETGNKAKGADAAAHAGYLDSAAGEKDMVSWHYTVDDHAIIQHLPDGEGGYHAGDSTGNRSSIGIEICVNEGGDFEAAKRNAAALVRLLMAEHKIPIANVVQHNRWSGKNCPATIRATPGGWAAFVALCECKETKPTEDYREAVKARFALADETVDYLAAYKYGPDLLRKLATQG